MNNKEKFLTLLSLITTLICGIFYATSAYAMGNGAPSGSFFQLQMIWSPKSVCSGTDGRVLKVPSDASFNISLVPGSDFEATPGRCELQLPVDVSSRYSLFVRPVGKPGSSSKIQTCATDIYGDEVCSIERSIQVRNKGKSSFSNVSSELLYITGYDAEGNLVKVPLFDSSLSNYIWKTETQGKVHLQMRFYEN